MFESTTDRSTREIVLAHLDTMQIGDVVTYDELLALLPGSSLSAARSAFARAVTNTEDNRHRTFANVRLVGYRMVEPVEHETLARGHHKRSKRQLSKATRKVHSADRTLLTPDERQRFDALELGLKRQQQMIRRLDARVSANEQALRDARRTTSEDIAATNEALARMQAAMRRAGLLEDVEVS